MNDYGRLISNISQDLSIRKDVSESDIFWTARVIYSSLGRVAQASLFDVVEDEELISVIHYKNRIIKTLNAYIDIYPELKELFCQPEEYADEIYNICLQTGCLYHSPNRISASIKKQVAYSNLDIVRGGSVGEQYCVSGIGTYRIIDSIKGCIDELFEMFHIPNESLTVLYDDIIKSAVWAELNGEYSREYLRTDGFYKHGYWVNKPELDGDVSLLRIITGGKYLYYLYKCIEDGMYISSISNHFFDGTNYFTLANSILAHKGTLPKIVISKSNQTVNILQQYLLPNELLNFLLLYSWPKDFKNNNHFERIMQKDVFEIFKEMLDYIGIEVG